MSPRQSLLRCASSTLAHSVKRTYATSGSRSSSSPHELLRSVMVGAPGSGKGTHASAIQKRWPSVRSVVSGNLLREHIKAGTELGKSAEQVMRQGGLLSDELMVDLIRPHIDECPSDVLLDGFPRTVGQARQLDDILSVLEKPLSLIVHLDVPEEVILQRIEARWYHPSSGRVYNDTFNPPQKKGVDDVTGEPLEKRIDDTRQVFGARIERFNAEAQPMLEYYREQDSKRKSGTQPRLVTVSGPTSKVIWPQIESVIKERFPRLRAAVEQEGDHKPIEHMQKGDHQGTVEMPPKSS